MIIARQKPFADILAMVGDARTVYIVGCGECATATETGGEREALAMKAQLEQAGKRVTGIDYYLLDLGIAGEHFCLQAAELGLGTCWIGWFSPGGVRKALGTPRRLRPAALFAVGYSAHERMPEKKRRVLDEICWFNEIG